MHGKRMEAYDVNEGCRKPKMRNRRQGPQSTTWMDTTLGAQNKVLKILDPSNTSFLVN